MNQKIKKAAVLGAGIMGSSIAAHLANVGIPSFLLDIVPPEMTEAEKKKGLLVRGEGIERVRHDSIVSTRAPTDQSHPEHRRPGPAPLQDGDPSSPAFGVK